MTTALSTIDQRLQEALGDRISVAVTTAIAANTSLISTNLRQFDGGNDDTFNDWWVYITDKANATVERQIGDYATATGTITVRGANLTTDGADLATVEVTRYRRTDRINAINRGIEEVGKSIIREVDDISLVSGNFLPNGHFNRWAVTTVPLLYSLSSVTAVEDTTAGEYWHEGKAAKVTASAGNGYLHISSDTYPRLLDLAGKTVDFTCMVKPQTANDAAIVIYTREADGTEQTLTSTTTNPAARWTQAQLLNQAINQDIEYISIRFKVATNGQYVIFDDAILTANGVLNEYWLPHDLQVGTLKQVQVQISRTGRDTSSALARPSDDLHGQDWRYVWGWDVINDGTYNYLRIPYGSNGYRLRLRGTAPLSGTLTAATDTIPLDASGALDALIAYARYWLLDKASMNLSSTDTNRIKADAAMAYQEYLRNMPAFSGAGMAMQMKGL